MNYSELRKMTNRMRSMKKNNDRGYPPSAVDQFRARAADASELPLRRVSPLYAQVTRPTPSRRFQPHLNVSESISAIASLICVKPEAQPTSTTNYQLSTTNLQFRNTHSEFRIPRCQLPTTNYQLTIPNYAFRIPN